MLAGQIPKLVNKQFNSPIHLYSPQNIQETLDRQTKILSNGAVGIDFNQLAKPANLQNSAVLKMLEEEEARQRNGGQPGLKRVAWPPPPTDDHQDIEYIEQSPIQAKTRGVGEYPSYQGSASSGSSPQPQNFEPHHHQQQQQYYHHHQPQTNLKPWTPSVQTPSSISPISPTSSNTWMPTSQHYQQPSILHSTNPRSQQLTFEPPPTTITLRPEPPISQIPVPVYQAQPAATLIPSMGGNMRGDLKWPPESVKQRSEMENQARLELAKGPAVRPRRVNKDYSGFFAQHALNSTYPGYRAPPGTQYFTPAYQQH